MTKKQSGKQRCFYLPIELDKKLCTMAIDESRSISNIVAIAIKSLIETKEAGNDAKNT